MHKISEDLWQKNANKKERKDDIECPQSQLQKEMREITKEKEKEVRRESGSPENEVSKGERKGLLNNRDIQCLQRATKYMWVIPNHFNQSFYMTLTELDETWYVNSTCGFVKPDKVSRLVALWLPS